MAALTSKLRSVAFARDGSRAGIAFWCPGCGSSHAIATRGSTGPIWDWDGSLEAPTASPSIRVTSRRVNVETICHSFLEAGRLRFLSDCTHSLAGQTVPLPDWPAGDEANFYLPAPHDTVQL